MDQKTQWIAHHLSHGLHTPYRSLSCKVNYLTLHKYSTYIVNHRRTKTNQVQSGPEPGELAAAVI